MHFQKSTLTPKEVLILLSITLGISIASHSHFFRGFLFGRMPLECAWGFLRRPYALQDLTSASKV